MNATKAGSVCGTQNAKHRDRLDSHDKSLGERNNLQGIANSETNGARLGADEINEAAAKVAALEVLKQNARRAWNDYQASGLHVTHEEADAWLAKLEAGEDAEPPKLHK
ncbi:hypothetical protein [Paraburkholderia sp. A1RO-1]|uniref:hypothetical protein n=1 Tax=unclassified Paraburkholderia TaxID=2615204 RepID=UPI003B7F0B4F